MRGLTRLLIDLYNPQVDVDLIRISTDVWQDVAASGRCGNYAEAIQVKTSEQGRLSAFLRYDRPFIDCPLQLLDSDVSYTRFPVL